MAKLPSAPAAVCYASLDQLPRVSIDSVNALTVQAIRPVFALMAFAVLAGLDYAELTVTAVPIPPSLLMLGSALLALPLVRRSRLA